MEAGGSLVFYFTNMFTMLQPLSSGIVDDVHAILDLLLSSRILSKRRSLCVCIYIDDYDD